MKRRFQILIRQFILPNVVPILLVLSLSYGVAAFRYFESFYHPGLSTFYERGYTSSDSIEPSLGLNGFIKYDNLERTFGVSVRQIDFEFDQITDKKPETICIEELLLAWDLAGKIDHPSRVISSPVCLPTDKQHEVDYYHPYTPNAVRYQFNVFELSPKPNLATWTSGWDFGVLYPFDHETYRVMSWLSYTINYSDGTIKSELASPTLDISGELENLTKGNWDVHASGMYRDISIGTSQEFPAVFAGQSIKTRYYTIDISRPFVIVALYISVLISVLGFVVVTFFITDTSIYLESILVFLFGLLGIKQLFPLPKDIATSFSLLDLILLFSYVLIGISGINFLINKYLLDTAPKSPSDTNKSVGVQSNTRSTAKIAPLKKLNRNKRPSTKKGASRPN